MAVSYPLTMPAQGCIRAVNFRMENASAKSTSPYTFDEDVYAYSGERWLADVTLAPMRRDKAAAWQAFLAACRGRIGTFLLGDPYGAAPRGTATAGTITGAAGDRTVSATILGTLVAGDYIQIGAGAGATLHMVLQDFAGSGSLEIWPALRQARSGAVMTVSNPKGVFRLAAPVAGWSVDELRIYGVSFVAEEVVQ